jgi:hypothetical protein
MLIVEKPPKKAQIAKEPKKGGFAGDISRLRGYNLCSAIQIGLLADLLLVQAQRIEYLFSLPERLNLFSIIADG